MKHSVILRAAAHGRTPLIKFLGKRTPPSKRHRHGPIFFFCMLKLVIESVDHAPHAHPASPTHSLPDSFASYRSKAQQHGPLGGQQAMHSRQMAYGAIGGHSGSSLGPVEPKEGEYFDRDQLPKRFRRTTWSEEEIEAVSSGGASLYG